MYLLNWPITKLRNWLWIGDEAPPVDDVDASSVDDDEDLEDPTPVLRPEDRELPIGFHGDPELPIGFHGDPELPPGDRDPELPPGDQEEELPPGDREEELPPGDREEELPGGDREEEPEPPSIELVLGAVALIYEVSKDFYDFVDKSFETSESAEKSETQQPTGERRQLSDVGESSEISQIADGPQEYYKCPDISHEQLFTNFDELVFHIKDIHWREDWSLCYDCNRAFLTRGAAEDHILDKGHSQIERKVKLKKGHSRKVKYQALAPASAPHHAPALHLAPPLHLAPARAPHHAPALHLAPTSAPQHAPALHLAPASAPQLFGGSSSGGGSSGGSSSGGGSSGLVGLALGIGSALLGGLEEQSRQQYPCPFRIHRGLTYTDFNLLVPHLQFKHRSDYWAACRTCRLTFVSRSTAIDHRSEKSHSLLENDGGVERPH